MNRVRAKRFTTVGRPGGRGRLYVPVPFDPDQVWAVKPRHHVGGTVDGHRFRAVIESGPDGWGFLLGPAWLRDCPIEPGATLRVVAEPEGPHREALADDLAAALAADPVAAAFYDGLAQFYRRAYLRWIDGTSRRPDVRAQRIAEVVALLHAGVKQRPSS
jgi:hypothetical protein